MLKYILILLISTSAFADTANVSWVDATARDDGTVLPKDEIEGYRIYLTDADSKGVPVTPTIINYISIPSGVSSHTFTVTGTKILNMTTIDTDGRESIFSPDKVINGKGLPGYPNVTVTVTVTIGVGNSL